MLFAWIFSCYVHFSTLLHLPPPSDFAVPEDAGIEPGANVLNRGMLGLNPGMLGSNPGLWDRTQDCWDRTQNC